MRRKMSALSISVYFDICFGVIFVIASVFVVTIVNRQMRNEALLVAREKTRILLERNLATHEYFSRELKPKLFDKISGIESKDYFEPSWMSSTCAIRQIDKYFNSFDEYGDYYYKECGINARSPENEADDYERAFIEELNQNPKLEVRSEIRKLDGQAYFVTLHRGETMEQSCLRCHSTPEKAPGDLVAQYGRQRSFNRKVGEVVSVVSVRVPLAQAYAATRATTIKLSVLLMVILGLMFSALYFFTRKVILQPLKVIKEKSSEISFDPEHLGEEMPLPFSKELSEVVSAFNNMSVKLRNNRDSLEQKILQRTSELEDSNKQLIVEVNDRKQAEEELQKSEEKFSKAFHLSPNIMALFDIENQRRIEVNDTFIKVTGYSREEILETSLTELNIHVDKQKALDAFQSLEKQSVRNFESVILTKQGQERTILFSGEMLNVSGKKCALVTGEDITESKQASQALQKSESELKAIYENAPLVMLLVDCERRVIKMNEQALSMSQRSMDDAVGLRGGEVLRCIHAFDDSRGCGFGPACEECVIRNAVLKTFNSGEAINRMESSLPYGDREDPVVMHLLVSTIQLSELQEDVVLVCLEDITERKQAEEREKQHQGELAHASRLSVMGQMASELAHELNQPLCAIMGHAESSLRAVKSIEPENEALIGKIETVISQTDKAGKIVSRIKNFARKNTVTRSDVCVNDVIGEALDVMSSEIKRDSVEIELKLDADIKSIQADSIQIEQVILNLIRNSIDAMKEIPLSGRKLTISTYLSDGTIEVVIEDTGKGICKKDIDKVFEPFFTTKSQGLGIGLSISHSIIETHRGRLWVESELGKGARFTLALPEW